MPVANEGLGWDPDPKNGMILVATVTGQGDNPTDMFYHARNRDTLSKKYLGSCQNTGSADNEG